MSANDFCQFLCCVLFVSWIIFVSLVVNMYGKHPLRVYQGTNSVDIYCAYVFIVLFNCFSQLKGCKLPDKRQLKWRRPSLDKKQSKKNVNSQTHVLKVNSNTESPSSKSNGRTNRYKWKRRTSQGKTKVDHVQSWISIYLFLL